jgi:hypothetical protein
MATTTNFGWTTPDDTDLVKDGAAAIRTLGSSIDTSLVDLKGGTTGQILAKASGTDLDFNWVADAGFTNPMTTTADLIYSSSGSTPARLGIGTAGQVLQVNSGATAPEWAAPTAAGANYTLLNSGGTTLSGASTTVSGISGKSDLLIYVDASTNATQASLELRLNADSTAGNYIYAGSRISGATTWAANKLEAQNSGVVNKTTIPMGYANDPATSPISAAVRIDGCSTTGFKSFNLTGSGSGTPNQQNRNLTGIYLGSAAITSITILTDDGSFTGGKVYVYGA